MKTTITRTALATLILLLSFTISSYAQTYYDVYICGNRSVKLHTPEESTLVNGDKVHWFDENDNPIGLPIAYSGPNTTDLVIPAALGVGLHQYKTRIESLGGCLGDPSELYTIYKLPTKTLALTENRAAYCAEESNSIKDATITATTTPLSPLPAGFEYAYTWSVTKNGTPYAPLSDIGTSDNSVTDVNKFTMTVKTAGTYVFSATVKYVKTVANTGVFVQEDNDGCSVSQTATQTITVTPKPVKPTISVIY
ncbi:hypothetical protein [Pedobacter sp. UBA4863]|uniref:hypothetical protein n=1 Tax=Pedobacter sp. UBA4863 TaxID=1947060 RepID=UPI0025F59695|nr:hypothetical protein [Pedobacter sp. UBA4863]